MVWKAMVRIGFIRWMIGAAVVLTISCGGRNLQRQEIGTEAPYADALRPEDFDPMSLDDDDVSLAEIWGTHSVQGTRVPRAREGEAAAGEARESEEVSKAPEEEETLADSVDTLRPAEVGTVEMEKVSGWRVQIVARESLEVAQRAKEKAMDVFDVPVYLQFEVPYYRVRIGDCRTLIEAEKLVRVARRKGYKTAFRVRTEILVEKRSP